MRTVIVTLADGRSIFGLHRHCRKTTTRARVNAIDQLLCLGKESDRNHAVLDFLQRVREPMRGRQAEEGDHSLVVQVQSVFGVVTSVPLRQLSGLARVCAIYIYRME